MYKLRFKSAKYSEQVALVEAEINREGDTDACFRASFSSGDSTPAVPFYGYKRLQFSIPSIICAGTHRDFTRGYPNPTCGHKWCINPKHYLPADYLKFLIVE